MKAGPLDEDERLIVETHPILGERILAPIEQLGEVRLIVRCAHEHYDGTGYPDHLSGEQIPLESRIVLACDAFHAMTTDRPYRKSLGEAEARRRLVEASGAQFDPQVVDALLRVGLRRKTGIRLAPDTGRAISLKAAASSPFSLTRPRLPRSAGLGRPTPRRAGRARWRSRTRPRCAVRRRPRSRGRSRAGT